METLPPKIQSLLEEVETAARTKIVFEHVPDLPSGMATVISHEGMPADSWADIELPRDAAIGPLRLTIRYRLEDLAGTQASHPAPYAALTHELLHCRRYLVQKVPRIARLANIPSSASDIPDHDLSVQGIEELLEHCAIEAHIRDYGVEHTPALSNRIVWDEAPKRAAQSKMFLWKAIAMWTKARLLTSNIGVQRAAEAAIERWGIARQAWWFTDQLAGLLASPDPIPAKLGMVFTVCEVLDMREDQVSLVYDEHRPECKPLPHSVEVSGRDRTSVVFQWRC